MKRAIRTTFPALAALVLATVRPAAGEVVRAPHIEAELVPETRSIRPGEMFWTALRLEMDRGWHVYWRNPGDSGLAPSIQWDLPDGFEAGEIRWPAPERIPFGPLTNFGYEGEVFLLVPITPPADLPAGGDVELAAKADWLVCEEVCIPGAGTFALPLPVRAEPPAPESKWTGAFARTRAALPAPAAGWRLEAGGAGKTLALRMAPESADARLPRRVAFFPFEPGLIANSEPQPLDRAGGALVLRIPVAPERTRPVERLAGVLVADRPWAGAEARAIEIDVAVGAPLAGLATSGAGSSVGGGGATGLTFPLALAFAFAGGILLNLMPCVFPVLAIKVLGFVRQGGEHRSRIAAHGFAFAAGVIVSFWALAGALLALRAGGAELGWGFQLQSPPVVAAMAFVLLALGLSLAGVFEIGAGLTALAGRAGAPGGYLGSFSGGVVATAVATPCTAPFMGSALAYAFTLPAAAALAVFTALAVGMAAPYVALSLAPGVARRLPRPGPWMETFKQAMAFPMLATVVWLAWVYGRQTGVDGLAALLVGLLGVAAACWVLGRWTAPGRGAGVRVAARAVAAALLVGAFFVATGVEPGVRDAEAGATADANGLVWEPYSDARVEALRAEGRPVLIDFTAAWCLTCQVNERVAFSSDAVRARIAEAGVALVKGDWTERDPEITRALARYGAGGVPLYVVYGRGPDAAPRILPSVLSPAVVLDALSELG